jgi:hypothetical protein
MEGSYRSFADTIEELAKDWARKCCSSETWDDLGWFGGSESRPFRVSNQKIIGLAKPGMQKVDGIPRAAHEKIASDLAFELGLPVPPVILWDRQSAGDPNRERYVAISAWAFTPALSWDEGSKNLSEDSRKQASVVVSAMLPFETWISAQDRKSDHLLIKVVGGRLEVAFIDYAFSLSQSWPGIDANVGQSPSYVPVVRDNAAIGAVSDRILNFGNDKIKTIIERIPNEYLPQSRREIIIANLLSRRNKIKRIMGL